MTASKNNSNSNWPIWLLAGGGFIAFLVVLAVYALWFRHADVSPNPDDWSKFGGYIGGVAGPLIALFTLIALVFTLRVQAKQLDDTRTELAKQSNSIAKQNFENTFFRLLRLIDDRVSGLDVGNLRGRQVITNLAQQLVCRLNNMGVMVATSDAADFVQCYRGFHASQSQQFGWYFQLVYQVLLTIDRSEVLNKQSYADILWAALSLDERRLLVYHGLTQLQDHAPALTARDFGTLIKRYGILEPFRTPENSPIPARYLGWYDQIPG